MNVDLRSGFHLDRESGLRNPLPMAKPTMRDIIELAHSRGFDVDPSPTSPNRILLSQEGGLVEPPNGGSSFSLEEAEQYLRGEPPW